VDKNKKILFCTTIFLFVVFSFLGCGLIGYEYYERAYKGPKRPISEIAVLEEATGSWYTVEKVDNNRVYLQPNKIHILPGQHTLKIEYTEPRLFTEMRGSLNVECSFEAGHVYRLNVTREEMFLRAWVEDITEQKK
jgi:hypothetical protein